MTKTEEKGRLCGVVTSLTRGVIKEKRAAGEDETCLGSSGSQVLSDGRDVHGTRRRTAGPNSKRPKIAGLQRRTGPVRLCERMRRTVDDSSGEWLGVSLYMWR